LIRLISPQNAVAVYQAKRCNHCYFRSPYTFLP